jgi:hypothetical protein
VPSKRQVDKWERERLERARKLAAAEADLGPRLRGGSENDWKSTGHNGLFNRKGDSKQ